MQSHFVELTYGLERLAMYIQVLKMFMIWIGMACKRLKVEKTMAIFLNVLKWNFPAGILIRLILKCFLAISGIMKECGACLLDIPLALPAINV